MKILFLALFFFTVVPGPEAKSHGSFYTFPEPSLKHLQELTDDTGIFEFAAYDVPDKKHAYCTEDNARALVAVLMFNSRYPGNQVAERLARVYLSYLLYAQLEDGNFSHRLDFQRRSKGVATEDSYGRTLWALGYAFAYPINDKMKKLAGRMFLEALPRSKNLIWPRAKAYSILGLHYYLKVCQSKQVKARLRYLADSLVTLYKKNSSEEWQWFENNLTYDNAKMPWALFLAYETTGDKDYLNVAKKTLDFLLGVNFRDGNRMKIIGNRGWYSKGEKAALYDEQPIDAAAMVEACAAAYKLTGLKRYREKMKQAFSWFLGNNVAGVAVYDFENGGSRDGIRENGLNENEGAESSIEVLISLLTLKSVLKK